MEGAEPTPERRYDERTYAALGEILRICDVGARLVARGSEWYASDPDNMPGLAAESLIIKIGENATRVSDACREDHPRVPWRDMKTMRNRLAHYYEGTDYQIVWDTLEGDFPALRDLIEEVVRSDLADDEAAPDIPLQQPARSRGGFKGLTKHSIATPSAETLDDSRGDR